MAEGLALHAAAGEPAISPEAEMASLAPTGRGADLRVAITVASAMLRAGAPALDVLKNLSHAACLRSIPARTSASSSRLATLWPATKRSTYGRAARIPPASGW